MIQESTGSEVLSVAVGEVSLSRQGELVLLLCSSHAPSMNALGMVDFSKRTKENGLEREREKERDKKVKN